MSVAERLVGELMLVSVLVAGEGAASLAAELEQHGAAAATLDGCTPGEGFDLAILLAPADGAADPAMRTVVAALSAASDRLLLAPLVAAADGGAADGPALPALTEWFEVFAEFGYQPVVEFDAAFVAQGAFLVDRAAIAAESELSAFADRLQSGTGAAGGAPAEPVASPAASRAALAEAQAALAAVQAALVASRTEAAALAARLAELSTQHDAAQDALLAAQSANAGWDALRRWVRAAAGDPARDTEASLRRDLPLLESWRGAAGPVAPPPGPRRRLFHVWPLRGGHLWPLRGGRAPSPVANILADAALVRASRLFDAAWYVASIPELSEGPAVDPVFHYLLVGGPAGADPGPWFDTQAYLAAHPDCVPATAAPLVHAIRTGADRTMVGA